MPGSSSSSSCSRQLHLWNAHFSFCGFQTALHCASHLPPCGLQPLRLACYTSLLPQESLQPFATTAAQTVWGCTLLDGWPLSEACCRLLCCIIDEAGLPHVCCPTPTSAACLHCTFSRRDSSFEEQLCCPWCANNCRQQLSLLWLGAGRGAALPFLAELWV